MAANPFRSFIIGTPNAYRRFSGNLRNSSLAESVSRSVQSERFELFECVLEIYLPNNCLLDRTASH